MNLFIILYGPAKTGKTLSAIASWPDALVVGPVGGTLSSRFLNHEPKFIPVGEQIAVKQIGEIIQKAQDEYPCIIIDDFSIICSTELMHCQASHRGWDANKEFNRRIRVLRDCPSNSLRMLTSWPELSTMKTHRVAGLTCTRLVQTRATRPATVLPSRPQLFP